FFMIAILLCAGFAVRMYPLTRDFPKPLLPIADRPVIDYLMDQMLRFKDLRAIHVISNACFHDHFDNWRKTWLPALAPHGIALQIHNDGATTNGNRLGACGDLQFGLREIAGTSKMLVSGGDNIFRFEIEPLWQRFIKSQDHFIIALPEMDKTRLQKTGVLTLVADDRVLRLHEKPQDPPSTWCCPPIYFLQPSAGERLDEFMRLSQHRDAPGHFIDYLCQKERVYAFKVNAGGRLDIGNMDSYRQADELMRSDPS
ncbi:MAG: sugar phosphate nucleotidyltransferase, partial [Desulfobacterales bacterium]